LPLVTIHELSDLEPISATTIFFVRRTQKGFHRVTFPDKETADFCLHMFEESALRGDLCVSEDYKLTHRNFIKMINSAAETESLKCNF